MGFVGGVFFLQELGLILHRFSAFFAEEKRTGGSGAISQEKIVVGQKMALLWEFKKGV